MALRGCQILCTILRSVFQYGKQLGVDLCLVFGKLFEVSPPGARARSSVAKGNVTVTSLPSPVNVHAVVVDLETSLPGIVQEPALLEVSGFPNATTGRDQGHAHGGGHRHQTASSASTSSTA